VIRSGWGKAPLRRLLLVSAAALIPVLAGCEAGDNAPTLEFHYPTDGAGAVVGDISIRNVFVLGAPLGSSLAPGQSASLFFALVNTGPSDRLLSISAPGSAASVSLPGGTVAVDMLKPVLFTGPQTQAYLVKLTRTLSGGTSIELVLHFQKAGNVTLQVPVQARASFYTTYSPPPSPATVTAAHGAARRHGRAGATPTVAPTPTPTPST
jgi:copper(I)-binding protein